MPCASASPSPGRRTSEAASLPLARNPCIHHSPLGVETIGPVVRRVMRGCFDRERFMKTTLDRLRDRAEEVVRREPTVEAVVLFGSRARRTAGPRSDWDVAVIQRRGSAAQSACRPLDDLPGVRVLGITARPVPGGCTMQGIGASSRPPPSRSSEASSAPGRPSASRSCGFARCPGAGRT